MVVIVAPLTISVGTWTVPICVAASMSLGFTGGGTGLLFGECFRDERLVVMPYPTTVAK
jgi:hypothetical protein